MSAAAKPTRRVDAPAEPSYELVDLDRYAVLDGGPVGYIEVIPPLFVCYVGTPYPKALEVAQVYDFEQAMSVVRETVRARCTRHARGRSAA